MVSQLLIAHALVGVALQLPPQKHMRDVTWPTHAVIALPQGWVKSADQLSILENDRPMAAQIEVAAKWPDGSPKWLHAHGLYRYQDGEPAKYELTRRARAPANKLKSLLTVVDSPSGIEIDTGAVKMRIARPFTGVTLLLGKDNEPSSVPGGPSMVDALGIAWHAMHDPTAELVIEQQGPVQVTVRASGWYQTAEKRLEPFCRYTTHITATADSPIIKFDHATIFAGDMRRHAIAELAFHFPLPKASAFSSGTLRGSFEGKLNGIWFAQLSADRLLTLSQQGADAARVRQIKDEKTHAAGWFGAEIGDRRVALLTKDFWQKCPKEVQIADRGITFYAWPKHGELSQSSADATRVENVYKFQCFHSGKLLDSRLPSDYFAALESQTDTTESRAEYARAANMEGVAMHNEFALCVVPTDGDGRQADRYLRGLQQLYAANPIARLGTAEIAASGVLGPVAALDSGFADVQTTVRDGMLGFAQSIERYGDYGWAIYGNTHHHELMNPAAAGVAGGRPSLHRVWNNNHYQYVSTSWRLWALDGDPRLLDWARTCSDYYASIGQVRYDGLRGHVDPNNVRRPGPAVKFHNPGAFWHCKAFVPWGCRDYGMDPNDADSGLIGHWPDPSGLLLAWLLDANRWAKEGYELWLKNVKFPNEGARREINTTLVHAITAYEYQPSDEILAAIKGMGKAIITIPLLKQQPGPLWEPTWLSRYHELFPDDKAFNDYIVASADAVGVQVEAIWSLALSATAYRITGDKKYLERHAGTLARVVRQIFHDPESDKRWEGYGLAPGPERDGHFLLQWPRFYAALKHAKIDSLAAPSEPGQYLCGVTRFDNAADIQARGTKILVWQRGAPAKLTLQGTPLAGGDIQAASLTLLGPRGQKLLEIPRLAISGGTGQFKLDTRPSSWGVAVENYKNPASDAGLYSVLVGSNQIGLFQPLTDKPECQVLRTSTQPQTSDACVFAAKLTRGYLVPLTQRKITLNFTAAGQRDGSTIALYDASEKPLVERSLRAGQSLKVVLSDGRQSNGPWLLDCYSDHSGFFTLAIEAETPEPLLYGSQLEDVQLIRQKLGK